MTDSPYFKVLTISLRFVINFIYFYYTFENNMAACVPIIATLSWYTTLVKVLLTVDIIPSYRLWAEGKP